MALSTAAVVVLVGWSLFCVSTAYSLDEELTVDEPALATRTLLSAAVFDGRVVAPVVGGRVLFRVRKVYKGWHGDTQSMTRLSRLICVSCRSQQLLNICRLNSAVVGQRYLVFAESFHAVVAVRDVQRSRVPVGVYRTAWPLVPLTPRSRRVTTLYSDLRFGACLTIYTVKYNTVLCFAKAVSLLRTLGVFCRPLHIETLETATERYAVTATP